MKVKFEHHETVARKVLAAVKKTMAGLNLHRPVTISVQTYRNGRENGYKLTAHHHETATRRTVDWAVWFSENRSSDNIVVYRCRDIRLAPILRDPNALMWKNRRYFDGDAVGAAARHIVNFLLFGVDVHKRVLSVKHLP